MRPGGGKAKGSQFEREVCTSLSKWVSKGKRTDLFWRSAMSGGRATVAHRKGVDVRQAGDITSVSPEGHILTDVYYIECKFYKDLDIASFFLDKRGKLWEFWQETLRQAEKHKRKPMLIARQNRREALLICGYQLIHFGTPLAHLYHGVNGVKVYNFKRVLKRRFR